MKKTVPREYLWVIRKSAYQELLIYISPTRPTKYQAFHDYVCYDEGKKVFGTFRIGQIKKFRIPLKEVKK